MGAMCGVRGRGGGTGGLEDRQMNDFGASERDHSR